MNDEKLDDSTFTFYFNFMMYLGSWVIETEDPWKKFFYILYSNAVSVWVWFITYMGVLDLIASVPDINKIFYNVCINLFIIGTWVKTIQTIHKSKRVNFLRRKLHRSIKTCKDPDEFNLCVSAIKDVNFISKTFTFFFVTCFPVWLVLSLYSDYWGERQYPLPAQWPVDVDINNLKTFLLIGLFHATFAMFYLCQAMSIDVSMFGLLIQIYREYQFLIKKIDEFGMLFEESDEENKKNGEKVKLREINIFLRKTKMRQVLGEIITRQQELFKFTEDFEYCYNLQMFIHIFAGGLLLCVNGVQTMIVSSDFSVKMGYQFGYVITIACDMLYLCWLVNRISIKCVEVGTAFYTTPWYKMDVDIQRDISLVILRSQKPPRITSGNFVELNLQTFMGMMKNLYSWLALFRQVALK